MFYMYINTKLITLIKIKLVEKTRTIIVHRSLEGNLSWTITSRTCGEQVVNMWWTFGSPHVVRRGEVRWGDGTCHENVVNMSWTCCEHAMNMAWTCCERRGGPPYLITIHYVLRSYFQEFAQPLNICIRYKGKQPNC